MNQQQIIKLLKDGELTLTDVIDAVIELNGIIGVGLITLGDDMGQYIKDYVYTGYLHKKEAVK